ncbi:PhzF family phenazine biosynthesis protein [Nocardia sp. NPDC088792]|uniref:PhzF family phenazine biosynthesis protein n=1 Tax=Nocardia sp. NPDC088792 TaxID=3364332 RepID=UPI003825F2AB
MTASTGTDVLRYAAFTTDPAGGNPAGIVLDAQGLDKAAMLAIADKVGYSETAFLTAPPPGFGTPGRAFTVRYFSPKAEVSFCGHATIATAVALAERIGPGELVFATSVGTVPVEVTRDEGGQLRATLTSVEPAVAPVTDGDLAEALAALNWAATDLDPVLPPRIAYAGAHHLVLAAKTRSRLADLHYDFDRLAALMRARDWTTVQLVWRESAQVYHVRNPFPVGGIVEDPATGASAAAFGGYLRELGLVGSTAELTLHQGDDLGRPGVLGVELRAGDSRVRVTGAAVALPD